jgi:Kef-type K+ transport system membrane component KefB
MHGDTLISLNSLIIFMILIMGMILKTIRIPYVVGYLFVGMVLGPQFLSSIQPSIPV